MTLLDQVTIPCATGDRPGLLALPTSAPPPWPGVVVVHDVFGMTPDLTRHVQRFAEAGYAAVAPDLYAGGSAGCVVRVLLSMITHEGEAFAALSATREWLAARTDVDESRLGLTGFCMGGGFALVAAADDQYAVVAPFYGAVPSERGRLRGICPTLAQYGGADLAFRGYADRLGSELERMGVEHEVVVYPGVGHSFMNDHRGVIHTVSRHLPPMFAAYDAPTEVEAWQRLLAFFQDHLRTNEAGT